MDAGCLKVRAGKKLEHEGTTYYCEVSCGKCCSGILDIPIHPTEQLVQHYRVVPNRIIYVTRTGLETFAGCGAGMFVLQKNETGGCVYLKDNRCSIYRRRPEVCRGYLCRARYREVDRYNKELNMQYEIIVRVSFNSIWTDGFLSRGGDKWGDFRRGLHTALLRDLRSSLPYRFRVHIHDMSVATPYHTSIYGSTDLPRSVKLSQVEKITKLCIATYIKTYVYKYTREQEVA